MRMRLNYNKSTAALKWLTASQLAAEITWNLFVLSIHRIKQLQKLSNSKWPCQNLNSYMWGKPKIQDTSRIPSNRKLKPANPEKEKMSYASQVDSDKEMMEIEDSEMRCRGDWRCQAPKRMHQRQVSHVSGMHRLNIASCRGTLHWATATAQWQAKWPTRAPDGNPNFKWETRVWKEIWKNFQDLPAEQDLRISAQAGEQHLSSSRTWNVTWSTAARKIWGGPGLELLVYTSQEPSMHLSPPHFALGLQKHRLPQRHLCVSCTRIHHL